MIATSGESQFLEKATQTEKLCTKTESEYNRCGHLRGEKK
jgi:hypothetical protein